MSYVLIGILAALFALYFESSHASLKSLLSGSFRLSQGSLKLSRPHFSNFNSGSLKPLEYRLKYFDLENETSARLFEDFKLEMLPDSCLESGIISDNYHGFTIFGSSQLAPVLSEQCGSISDFEVCSTDDSDIGLGAHAFTLTIIMATLFLSGYLFIPLSGQSRRFDESHWHYLRRRWKLVYQFRRNLERYPHLQIVDRHINWFFREFCGDPDDSTDQDHFYRFMRHQLWLASLLTPARNPRAYFLYQLGNSHFGYHCFNRSRRDRRLEAMLRSSQHFSTFQFGKSYFGPTLSGPEFRGDVAGDGASERDTSSSNQFRHLPLYDSAEYLTWKSSFVTMLDEDLFNIIRDISVPPLLATDPAADPVEESSRINKLKTLNRRLYQCIFYSITNSSDTNSRVAQKVLEDAGNPVDSNSWNGFAGWKALSDYHITKTAQNKIGVMSKFFTASMSAEESPEQFKTRLDTAFARWKSLKISEEEIVAFKFLHGLSDRYQLFRQTISVRPDGTFTASELLKSLQSWEAAQGIEESATAALASSSSSSFTSPSSSVSSSSIFGEILQREFANYQKFLSGKSGTSNDSKKRSRSDDKTSSTSQGKDKKVKLSNKELNEKYGQSPAPHELTVTCFNCKKKGHSVRTCTETVKPEFQKYRGMIAVGDLNPAISSLTFAPSILEPPDAPQESTRSSTAAVGFSTASANLAVEVSPARANFCSSSSSAATFIVDSGCSRHMAGKSIRTSWFSSYLPTSATVQSFNGNIIKAMGSAAFGFLRDMLHVPAESNLLSVSQICKDGYVAVFTGNEFRLFPQAAVTCQGTPLLTGPQVDGLYHLTVTPTDNLVTIPIIPSSDSQGEDSANLSSVVCDNSFTLWHNRLGHFGKRVLSNINKNKSLYCCSGVNFSKLDLKKHLHSPICEGCAFGKMHLEKVRRHPNPTSTTSRRVDSSDSPVSTSDNPYLPGELVVADLMHSPVAAHQSGSEYALVLVDAATRYTWVYTIRDKDHESILEKLKEWLQWMAAHNITVGAFTTLRTDNGTEFLSEPVLSSLASVGIKHERSPPYRHVYLVERTILTLREMIRSALYYRRIKLGFWAEAAHYCTYILNRIPPASCPTSTRYEMFHGTRPRIDHVRTFGCPVYARSYDERTQKWDERAWKGVFVGFSPDTLSTSPLTWKIWNPSTHQYINTSSVVFDESLPGKEGKTEFDHAAEAEGLTRLFADESYPDTNIGEDDIEHELDSVPVVVDSTVRRSSRLKRPLEEPQPRRSLRLRETAKFIEIDDDSELSRDDVSALSARCLSAFDRILPRNYEEATTGPDASEWVPATDKELSSIIKADCLEIVEKPDGARILPYKWVYKIKETMTGAIERYKVRLTVGGHRQIYGINYEETFAPVVRFTTVRILMAVAAARGLHLHQMDVDTAFLYGALPQEDTVYMKIPEGYPIPEGLQGKPDLVAKLKKSLYGLKQAPRLWNATLDEALKNMGFNQSWYDSCLYVKGYGDHVLYVTVYVDDLVIAGANMSDILNFKSEISTRFNMKDLGELKYVLGIEVIKTEDNITLNQSKYALDVLKRFGMESCHPTTIPLDPGTYLSHDAQSTDSDKFFAKNADKYREIVGSLMYLMICSRPDLAFAVGFLSRYLNKFDKRHMRAAYHVLRYLRGTTEKGVIYSARSNLKLEGFSDSDWGSDLDTRRSTTGYIFMLAGGPVSWKSKRQQSVALSSSEAEYMALCAAAQEAIALRALCSDFHIDDKPPTLIWEDNSGAIAMSKNPIHYEKTKHIHLKYHFIRERVFSNDIVVRYLPTSRMLADALTKALPKLIYTRLRDEYMGSVVDII